MKEGFDEAFEAAQGGKPLKPLDMTGYQAVIRAVGKPRFEKQLKEPSGCEHKRRSELGITLVCLDCGRTDL